MKKPTIVFYDINPNEQGYFEKNLGDNCELVFTSKTLSPDTAGLAHDANIISLHAASKAPSEVLSKMPHLKHIALRITGFDNIDRQYAAAHDIGISNVPAYGEATVAEYAFMLLLAVARRLMPAAHSVQAGAIDPHKLVGHDMYGKTLGVVGAGRIGRHAAKIARGFGMTVLAYDPYPNAAAASDIGYAYTPLDDLLERSDYITLHAPATPENFHLMSGKQFAKMKHGAIIINTGRGTLIDTPALIGALESGRVGGAGLDVLEGEEYMQLSSEFRLIEEHQISDESRQVLNLDILSKMPNVLITSHNAYNSAEALGRIRSTTVSNIKGYLEGHPANLVAAS